LETVGLRIPAQCIRGSALFNICSLNETCRFAIYASAANVIPKDAEVFGTKTVFLNHIL
jgi:hypothetical protein